MLPLRLLCRSRHSSNGVRFKITLFFFSVQCPTVTSSLCYVRVLPCNPVFSPYHISPCYPQVFVFISVSNVQLLPFLSVQTSSVRPYPLAISKCIFSIVMHKCVRMGFCEAGGSAAAELNEEWRRSDALKHMKTFLVDS